MRRQYPDRLDLFLPTLAWFFRIAPAILRLHLSVPSCQQSLTSGYGSIGAQSVAVGKVPGLIDIHGGGQTASRGTVEQMAANGYVCISINSGAHPLPELKPGDPNTEWGAVDDTQTMHLGQYFCMTAIPVSKRGTITLPPEIRKTLGLDAAE